tara:strand:+ start:241 stop:354 length:114 start_codon:yes stop_codon:yes gene_type:complete
MGNGFPCFIFQWLEDEKVIDFKLFFGLGFLFLAAIIQ